MNKEKYKDFFTEYNFNTINYKEIEDKTDHNLRKIVPGPLNDNNVGKVLKEYYKYFLRGIEHEYIRLNAIKYGGNELSNILIPSLEDNKYIKDLIIILDPDDCQRLGRKHIKKMPKYSNILLDSLLSTTNNEHWQCQRHHLVQSFLPKPILEDVMYISENSAKNLINKVNLSKLENKDIDMSNLLLNETQAQLQLSLFGVDKEFELKHNYNLRKAFSGFGEVGYVRKFSFEMIENIKNGNFNGPLSKYLRSSPQMTDTELYANIILFAFAGHDTTGHTLTWLFYELSRNFNIQKKLCEEVDIFFKEQGNRKIKYDDFKRLPYMKRCIAETLRLWPALANGTYRELQHDDYIRVNGSNIMIPKGTYIQIPNIIRHRSKKLWGEDAMVFNPDRNFTEDEIWHNNMSGINMESKRYSPFSFNRRSCIGRPFAHIEMRLIILYLLKDNYFMLSKNQKRKNLEFNKGTMGPKNNIKKFPVHKMLLNIVSRKSKL